MLARGQAGGQVGGHIVGLLRIIKIRSLGGAVWKQIGDVNCRFVKELLL